MTGHDAFTRLKYEATRMRHADLAEAVGVSGATLSRWLSAKNAPQGMTVAKLVTWAESLPALDAKPLPRANFDALTTGPDPVAALVRQGQAEQAAWVLEFAAKLLEAGAQRLRQGVQREAIISAVEATEATITRPTTKRRRASEG